MGMSKLNNIFNKLKDCNDAGTKEAAETVYNLYLGALRGVMSCGEMMHYINENKIDGLVAKEYKSDYNDLVDLVGRMLSSQ